MGRIRSLFHLIKDDLTDAIVNIDFEHHEIHEGNTWHKIAKATISIGATTVFLFRPSATKTTHLVFHASSQLESTLELFKNPTYSASGTVSTATNKLASGGDPTSGLRFSATVTASGTLIDAVMIGDSGGAGGGGAGGSRNEWVNDVAGVEYLLRLTSNANTNLTALAIEWYEEGVI